MDLEPECKQHLWKPDTLRRTIAGTPHDIWLLHANNGSAAGQTTLPRST
jgi:hypothetical protein